MEENYLKKGFIDQAKPALNRHSGGGSGGGVAILTSTAPSKSLAISGIEGLKLSCPNATSIGNLAFDEYTGLTSIDLPVAESIGNYAFSNCTGLTSVDLPVATSIGSNAFYGCLGLTSIDLPAATEIGNSAFDRCTSLTSVDLPVATSINYAAFYGCTDLTSVELPVATSIGDSAFYNCTSLTSVDLPAATSIDNNEFYNCTSLTSVDLPAATSIGGGAFYGCTGLTSIDLPAATSIGENAFYKCVNLKALILRTTETVCVIDPTALALDTDDNGNPTQLLNVYVPASMFEHYRAGYEPAFEEYGFAGYFDVVFHKIEDYPEICGPTETPEEGGESTTGFPITWNTIGVNSDPAFVIDEMPYVKVSDYVPSFDEALGSTFTVPDFENPDSLLVYSAREQMSVDDDRIMSVHYELWANGGRYELLMFWIKEDGEYPELEAGFLEAGLYAPNYGITGFDWNLTIDIAS